MAVSSPKEFGKYYLVDRIAVGGMAEIYKARYHVGGGLEKTCVVKRILPHYASNPAFVTMFHDEASVCVRLTHANIAQVFDFGRVGNEHFLAMEYVQGQNLQRILHRVRKRNEKLPPSFALYIAAEVAKGLHYAHTRKDQHGKPLGIIHRDVSPANILLSYEGEVKLVDFGIAKAASQSERTQAGIIKGKVSYMAPEYLLGLELDARVDVFALGAVLWEMLVGEKLFTGENEVEVIHKVQHHDPDPPSLFNPDIQPPVDRVTSTALARDRSQRYASASEMHRDVAKVSASLGWAVTQPDVGEYLQALFSHEMEEEMHADREISKTFVGLTVKMDPPDTLTPTPDPILLVDDGDTSPSLKPADLTDQSLPPTAVEIPSAPEDVTDTVTSANEGTPVKPARVAPPEVSAAAKRQAQRNIKAGVLKPPRVRRGPGLTIVLLFMLVVVLAIAFIVFAPLFGINLPIRP